MPHHKMCSDSDLPHDDINVAVVGDDDDEFNARAFINRVSLLL